MSDSDVDTGAVSAPEDEEKKEYEDIRSTDVVTKYKLASDIANAALKKVMDACKAGAKVVDLCEIGDKHMTEETEKIYNKGKLQKGVGFPTCVSVNNIVGSFSPMKTDTTELKAGDVVKIDLGCHIDGYLSQVAHTVVVDTDTVTGRVADVVSAAYVAANCALRMLKPGVKNVDITKVIAMVGEEFDVRPIEGVFSHQVTRFEIDGEKKVANAKVDPSTLPEKERPKEETLEVNEVWSLDFLFSTGQGKPQPRDDRDTTVFRRVVDNTYKLKIAAARGVLSEIRERFPMFPFSLRALNYEGGKLRFGIVNCLQHDLVEPYSILFEKEGEYVSHVKFTALLRGDGTLKVTGLPYDLSNTNIKSEKTIQNQELKDILAQPLPGKKKNKKKKKKKATK